MFPRVTGDVEKGQRSKLEPGVSSGSSHLDPVLCLVAGFWWRLGCFWVAADVIRTLKRVNNDALICSCIL